MVRTMTMILTGSCGRSIDIIGYARPKPTLPFAGKYRIIDFTLSNCIHSRLRGIAVPTDYRRSTMTIYIRSWVMANAGPEVIQIIEPRIGSHFGTADAVYQSLDYMTESGADTVLILTGDHIYRMDYRDILDFHTKMEADITVGAVTMPVAQANSYGTIVTDTEGRITDLSGKPGKPQQIAFVSMGIYVFKLDVLLKSLIHDSPRLNSKHELENAILPFMVKRTRAFAYRFDGYWRDVSTPQAYYNACMELLSQYSGLSLNGTRPVLTAPSHLSPAKIFRQGSVINSLVSPGCIVKGDVKNSILSPGVWVEEKAIVENSVLMTNTFIGYHSLVRNSILDESVNIGKFCYVGFAKNRISGNPNLTVIGREVTVPPGTAICGNCKVPPHTKPEDFTSAIVQESTVIKNQAIRLEAFSDEERLQ